MQVWTDYLERFGLETDQIRSGCEPLVAQHAMPRGSVVLIHGLSDSPHYMRAIGSHLHAVQHLDVYLPLLNAHGLHKPEGMETVTLENWQANVEWSIGQAHLRTPGQISIGGLSTGGALALWATKNDPRVSASLLLFSAALDLSIRGLSTLGWLAERLVRISWLNDMLDWLTRRRKLVGLNPYRYAHIDYDGARELSLLLKQNDAIIRKLADGAALGARVFIAHSYADETAHIKGALRFRAALASGTPAAEHFYPKSLKIGHANLVLEEDVLAGGQTLERANSHFGELVGALDRFFEHN